MERRLDEMLLCGYEPAHVDLYGGEVGLLSEEYLESLDRLLRSRGAKTVNVITNLYKIHSYFLREDVDLAVSFDFEARQSHKKVLLNMAGVGKDLSVLMLASPSLMSKEVGPMIETFNGLRNIRSVEIKPYSANQANDLVRDHESFESFVKKWIECPVSKNFDFVNLQLIKTALGGKRNAYSDDHVYLTPSGRFAVLEFDSEDKEYFLELNSFEEYLEWKNEEKRRVAENSYCSRCEYLGRCLTEHYREVCSVENSCNGYYKLLKWSETKI